ncbi:gluconokinase [Pseudoduganella ginsengisoli]|uniref:Gluconokinase n=2 Tax=Pseudoduganella ginsengisoli TaxID=1462440 RepID=A0A6L6Q5G0_9BURK|nr:AAA family ATPase [Pseudoduganella ginsengisoli]
MGVCGSGKSEVGHRVAQALGAAFIEGDDYHSPANVAKMASGIPLDDTDRAAWLQRLREEIAMARETGAGLVVSCSALKRRYRDVLREGDPALRFAHLHGERGVIAQRLAARKDHYMPPALLDSQLQALEPLQSNEAGVTLDITATPQELADAIVHANAAAPQASAAPMATARPQPPATSNAA